MNDYLAVRNNLVMAHACVQNFLGPKELKKDGSLSNSQKRNVSIFFVQLVKEVKVQNCHTRTCTSKELGNLNVFFVDNMLTIIEVKQISKVTSGAVFV